MGNRERRGHEDRHYHRERLSFGVKPYYVGADGSRVSLGLDVRVSGQRSGRMIPLGVGQKEQLSKGSFFSGTVDNYESQSR
jgi:hypothetical protein